MSYVRAHSKIQARFYPETLLSAQSLFYPLADIRLWNFDYSMLPSSGRTRVSFNPGEGSLTLWQLRAEDAGRYICEVRVQSKEDSGVVELIIPSGR